MNQKVSRLVRTSVALHNLNRDAEKRFSVSLVQFHVLVNLRERPGISPLKLSEFTGVHPSTLTPLLKRLGQKGLITSGTDPVDQRMKVLMLTRKGADCMKEVEGGLAPFLNESSLSLDRL